MTLLEAVVALVILGLSAIGYLEASRGSAAAMHHARQWSAMVGAAESAMEGATLGDAMQAQAGLPVAGGAGPLRTELELRAWRPGVREVVVTVTATDGTQLHVRRLARERQP